jgi:hypothetical protein
MSASQWRRIVKYYHSNSLQASLIKFPILGFLCCLTLWQKSVSDEECLDARNGALTSSTDILRDMGLYMQHTIPQHRSAHRVLCRLSLAARRAQTPGGTPNGCGSRRQRIAVLMKEAASLTTLGLMRVMRRQSLF